MFGLNEVTIIGNVGSTPELRFTPTGLSVVSFNVATNRRFMKGDERVEETEWFSVVVWGKLAENCNQYLNKGQLVFVSGRITLNKWERPDGTQASSLEVHARNVIFLSRSKQSVEAEEVEPEEV